MQVVVRASHGWSRVRVRLGWVLERDADAALPATSLTICLALSWKSLCRKLRRGRSQGVYGSMRVDPPPSDRRTWPRSTRRTRSRAVYHADEHVEGVQEAGRKTWKGTKEGHVLTLCMLSY